MESNHQLHGETCLDVRKLLLSEAQTLFGVGDLAAFGLDALGDGEVVGHGEHPLEQAGPCQGHGPQLLHGEPGVCHVLPDALHLRACGRGGARMFFEGRVG